MTTHRALAHHSNKGTHLFDGCDRCEEHSKTLYDLDDGTIQWLAGMSELMKDNGSGVIGKTFNLSMNERRAITKLRLYARVTFRSGITEEAAN